MQRPFLFGEEMSKYVLLDNVTHKDMKVVTRYSAEFGDSVNQVLVFPSEYADIQKEYPIFFRRDSESGEFQSAAMLGLDRDENLFLEGGDWKANYIPAVQARGPFLIGFQQKEVDGELHREPVIHVDMENPRVNEKEGQPVFLPHGGNSPYLERVASILRVIHSGSEMSKPMFSAFEAHGLIQPVEVEIKLNDLEQYTLSDYYTVSEEKLAELDGDSLEQLHRAGFLKYAFLVAASLSNVSRLIEMKNRKSAVTDRG